MATLRLIFAGTPKIAASHLESIIESQHQILAVYTQPDRPSGRGRKLVSSPVKQLAEKNDIPLCQPISLRSKEEQEKAEKSALSTAKYLWNFLTGIAVKHNIPMQAAA